MRDAKIETFFNKHENSIVNIVTVISLTILGGLLLTATGKVLEVTANENVESSVDPDGTEVRHTNNDRKVKFYSE